MGMLSLDDLVEKERNLLLQEIRIKFYALGPVTDSYQMLQDLKNLCDEEGAEWWDMHERMRLTELQVAALNNNLEFIEENLLNRLNYREYPGEQEYDYC